AEVVMRRGKLSRAESTEIVRAVIEGISDALAHGDDVKLSSFGTFSLHSKGERVGRNPRNGQEYPITARRVVKFKASSKLRSKVALGGEDPSTATASPSKIADLHE